MTDTTSTRPQTGDEEILTAVKMRLREHWLTGIHCDHKRKTDRASCSCSVWRGEEKPSIAAAVQDSVKHAMPTFPLRTSTPAQSVLVEASPDDIRAQGWIVAVHNDYCLNGEPHTFWLFTKGNTAIKGKGRTDAEALAIVRDALSHAPFQPAPTNEKGTGIK